MLQPEVSEGDKPYSLNFSQIVALEGLIEQLRHYNSELFFPKNAISVSLTSSCAQKMTQITESKKRIGRTFRKHFPISIKLFLSRQSFGPEFCVVWPRKKPASGWGSIWDSSSFVPWFSTFEFRNVPGTVSEGVVICWFKRNSSNLGRAPKMGTLSCWTPGTLF